jgi:hypothetical protein
MTENRTMDTILEAAIENKQLFSNPRLLSYQNEDVVADYNLHMLKIFDEDQRDKIVEGFCKEFEVDKEEMKALLSNKDFWVDFSLYHTFSAYCQKKSGIEDDNEFFSKVAKNTFTDKENMRLRLARHVVSLDDVIRDFQKENNNQSRVLRTTAERQEKDKIFITRETKIEYKKKLQRELNREGMLAALKRDCIISYEVYKVVFNELFQQPNLEIITIESEGNGASMSTYQVIPQNPFSSKIGKMIGWTKDFFVGAVPWLGLYLERRKRNKQVGLLRDEALNHQERVRDSTGIVKKQTVELTQSLERISELSSTVSNLLASGHRHLIWNLLSRTYETEKNTLVGKIACEVNFIYNSLEGDQIGQQYIIDLCGAFDIDKEMLLAGDGAIARKLHTIEIYTSKKDEKEASQNTEGILDNEDDDDGMEDFDDLFDGMEDIFGFDYTLENCIDKAKEVQKKFNESNVNHLLQDYNPFSILMNPHEIKRITGVINGLFSQSQNLVDTVNFNDCLNEAIEQANKENLEIEVIRKGKYNPELKTNKPTFVYFLQDQIRNAYDAGASKISVTVKRPALEVNLPFFNRVKENGQPPEAYIQFEDNGRGISQEKAEELTNYLKGATDDTGGLSSKGTEGGGGTKYMRMILGSHQGRAFYERKVKEDTSGTRVHTYLKRLSSI